VALWAGSQWVITYRPSGASHLAFR
jgi:hypothetical protein